MSSGDPRLPGPVLTAVVAANADPHPALDRIDLLSPTVGVWRQQVATGQLVQAGEPIGTLTTLGVVHLVVAGPGARGAVVAPGSPRREVAVGFRQALVALDRTAIATDRGASPSASPANVGGELTIRAPSSGRFYGRSAPGKPPFVTIGELLRPGQTVGLLEVMKTFHRVTAGDDLPAGARVTAIVVGDDTDVDVGAVLVRLKETS